MQRIKNIYKPTDILYAAYEQTGFRDLDLSNQNQLDPDVQQLTNYINAVKEKLIKLDDIPFEYREKLAKLIIGDDNNNNTT